MYKKFHHLIDRSNETSSEEQLLIEPVTDARWAQSWFQTYACDLEELARFADDAEVRATAGRLRHFARDIHTFIAMRLAALREEAGGITVIELTCEELKPQTADGGSSGDTHAERQR